MFASLSCRMLWLAPALAAGISGICYYNGLSLPATICAWVALVCALWWIFECLHIAVVGLVPFVAFPLFGIIDHTQIAASYGHSMILLLLGGFFLSAAMERSGAHRRVAVTMVRAVGGRGGRRLVLGFMLATALLSMWISNSATALMMLPIAMAVLSQSQDASLRVPLLLGIAYSASIGGMATPIGTPPNVIFMSMIDREITFAHWMSYGVPVVVLLLPITWWWLTRSISTTSLIEMPGVGRWRSSELRVMLVFAITALLWIFRASPWGGWSTLIPGGEKTIGDSTIALAAAVCLFVLPAGERLSSHGSRDTDETADEPPEDSPRLSDRLLDWDSAVKIPWGILIMFGGGLALADGFEATGLSRVIGTRLAVFSDAPEWVVVLAVCLMVTFLTEVTSSTATATLLLPILGELAVATGLDPVTVMIPGTISCSCAFMLPIATAPNVIVYGAGGIRTDEMARTGLALNLVAAGVITLVTLVVSRGLWGSL